MYLSPDVRQRDAGKSLVKIEGRPAFYRETTIFVPISPAKTTMRDKKRFSGSRSPLTIVTLAAFMLLGFCPLRNSLLRLAGGSPEKAARLIPDYRKISSASQCELVFRLKELPPTGQVDHSPSIDPAPALPASSTFNPAAPPAPGVIRDQISRRGPPAIPIYLFNRVLRI